MRIPKFLLKMIPGFYIKDLKEWLKQGHIDIYLEHHYSNKESTCHKCQSKFDRITGNYRQKIQAMPIMSYKAFLYIKRRKGYCSTCSKIRSEHLDFISEETPHLTREYSWWLGRMCEIAPVSRVGEISVIWVSESREKAALDEFFNVIGPERCKEIDVVAMDQHDAYKLSVEENCPMATVVWDRFHIMQNFNEALNGDRQWIHRYIAKGELKRLSRSKFKRLFVKKSDRRTKVETRHINDVLKENEDFAFLEIIKEGMYQLYDSKTSWEARDKFDQIGEWIDQCSNFYELKKWWKNFNRGWDTFKNYFHYRVSSSLSEGQNNAIKVLKRRGYGYRNMPYFKLKILQTCGFLNSRYVPMSF
jgi:transposase